jgi:LacI family transcriptional regulator
MAKLSEVAKEAGVSVSTVSMVLNKTKRSQRISEACAKRVREAAKKLGYVPNYHARSMKLGRAEVIGVALDVTYQETPGHTDLGQAYLANLVGAIEKKTRQMGYWMAVIGPTKKERAIERGANALRQRRLDGLIIPAPMIARWRLHLLQQLPEAPVVIVECSEPVSHPVVDFDDKSGVALAVKHLAQMGHKNLLWLGQSENWNADRAQDREQAFITDVWDAGLKGAKATFGPEDMVTDGIHSEEKMIDTACHAVSRRIAEGTFDQTGIVCYNDLCAIGALRACRQAGLRVPQDVSVVGFDDLQACMASPKLTTIDHRLSAVGGRATELVLDISLDKKNFEEFRGHRETIEPELLIRESTGPAPKKK